EEVGVTVAVDVGTGGAEGETRLARVRLLRDVGEVEAAVVAKEAIEHRVGRGVAGQRRPLREPEVEVPVAVVVEQRDAARVDLGKVLATAAAVIVHEVDAGALEAP